MYLDSNEIFFCNFDVYLQITIGTCHRIRDDYWGIEAPTTKERHDAGIKLLETYQVFILILFCN